MLREFEKCGVILKHVPGPREANWMHILYQVLLVCLVSSFERLFFCYFFSCYRCKFSFGFWLLALLWFFYMNEQLHLRNIRELSLKVDKDGDTYERI